MKQIVSPLAVERPANRQVGRVKWISAAQGRWIPGSAGMTHLVLHSAKLLLIIICGRQTKDGGGAIALGTWQGAFGPQEIDQWHVPAPTRFRAHPKNRA